MCGNGNAMSNEQFKDLMMMTAIPIELKKESRRGPDPLRARNPNTQQDPTGGFSP